MHHKEISTEICIIGAGPAGATTALFLAKYEVPHLLLDAAAFPRDKVCGDALDLKVIRVLNQLDPSICEEMMQSDNFYKSWGCKIIVSEKKQPEFIIDQNKRNDQYPFFFTTRRKYFDNFLVSKLNQKFTTFYQQTKVVRLEKTQNGWLVYANCAGEAIIIKTKMIVGADGDHSVVLRHLHERKIDRSNYAAALRQYWKGISGITPDNKLEIYIPTSLPLGYLWIFPLGNGEANVGCGLLSDIVAKKGIDLKKLMHNIITNDPAIAPRFKNATPLEKPVGWGLPLASQRRNAYGDNYLLVGDAASMISPTTGEGIGTGMVSAFVAAKYIQRAVQQNRFDKNMFKNYNREIIKRHEGDIRKFVFIKSISPYLYGLLINSVTLTTWSKKLFLREVDRWNNTAKNKEIVVDM